jgi:para-nitrobenzyl esterase
MIEPARFVARSFAASGGPVFEYRFGYVADEKRAASPWGADHSTEVAYVFDKLEAAYDHVTPEDRAVAATMAEYWAEFARDGDPNGEGLPVWPRYAPGSDLLLSVTPSGDFVGRADPLQARLDFMQARADDR